MQKDDANSGDYMRKVCIEQRLVITRKEKLEKLQLLKQWQS